MRFSKDHGDFMLLRGVAGPTGIAIALTGANAEKDQCAKDDACVQYLGK